VRAPRCASLGLVPGMARRSCGSLYHGHGGEARRDAQGVKCDDIRPTPYAGKRRRRSRWIHHHRRGARVPGVANQAQGG
jgi:hypothetical protein